MAIVGLVSRTAGRAALLLLLLAITADPARAQDDIEHGRLLLTKFCGECHAVGRTGASPHAGAPAFRSIDDRTDLDKFADRLRTGLQSTHAHMPSFRFSREDARAAVAYLRSIQSP